MKWMLPVLFAASSLFAASTNSIDAVSSASTKYKVLGGTAYADSAVINFYGKYSSTTSGREAIYFSYGTTAGTYDKQVILKIKSGSTNTNPNTIRPLKPDTKYYYKMWSNYSTDCASLCVGTFTTGSVPTSITPSKSISSSNFVMFPNQKGVSLQLISYTPYTLQLFTVQGKVVTQISGIADVSGRAEFSYPVLAHGNYILKVTSHGVTLVDNITIQ